MTYRKIDTSKVNHEINMDFSQIQNGLAKFKSHTSWYHNGCPNDRYTVQYTYFDEWIGLIDEFVDNIRNNKTPLINLKWHKKTIEAMNAVYESIKSGKVVKL